jgi:hypothetical protein
MDGGGVFLYQCPQVRFTDEMYRTMEITKCCLIHILVDDVYLAVHVYGHQLPRTLFPLIDSHVLLICGPVNFVY